MTEHPPQEQREMFDEIAALVGGLMKAFDMDEAAVISALEDNAFTMTFDIDANGNNFVLAEYGGRAARLYAGAVKLEEPLSH